MSFFKITPTTHINTKLAAAVAMAKAKLAMIALMIRRGLYLGAAKRTMAINHKAAITIHVTNITIAMYNGAADNAVAAPITTAALATTTW